MGAELIRQLVINLKTDNNSNYQKFQLLSASTDHNVCIWDVLSGECEQRYRFPTPILRVQFDPRNDKRFLVCPMRHAALLVDTDGEHKILPIDEDVS